MDLYLFFKLLHVIAAIAWVGGGVILFFLGLRASAQKDETAMVQVINQVISTSTIWFIPASLATLVFGLVVAFLGNLWSEAWVILGLLGWAATFCTGNFILKPTADGIGKASAEGNVAERNALAAKIIQVSKFDYVMLFLVVADMVLKPTWNDLAVLGAMAAILVLAAALFLPRAFKTVSASA